MKSNEIDYSLTTVFNNSEVSHGKTPFGNLVKGLYAASCGASSGEKPDDSKVNTGPAFDLNFMYGFTVFDLLNFAYEEGLKRVNCHIVYLKH